MTTEINNPIENIWSCEVACLAIGQWFMYNSMLHRVVGIKNENAVYVNMESGVSILIKGSDKVLQVDATIDAKYKMK
jgi:hypothetical protein